jgi:cytoskeletal protein CcmA (bactofilin family)
MIKPCISKPISKQDPIKMNHDSNHNDLIESTTAINPGKTPLIIGPGIVLKGNIVNEDGDPESQMMIMGRVEGDITTKGVIQIAKGGEIAGNSMITAGAIVIAGQITGSNVSIRTNLLVMHSTSVVDVAMVFVPPGCLEMKRGSLLVGQLSRASALASEPQGSKFEAQGIDAQMQGIASSSDHSDPEIAESAWVVTHA